jgi:hypothetical protein
MKSGNNLNLDNYIRKFEIYLGLFARGIMDKFVL